MTITDTPSHRAEANEAQVLFEEARQRRRRRWTIGGVVLAFVVVIGIAIALLVSTGSGSTRPVATASPAPATVTAASASKFSIRQVLCYAPPYTGASGQTPVTGPLPTCAPPYQLTTSNLEVTPASNNVNGYTSTANIDPDPQFASYPSTSSMGERPQQTIILPGSPSNGSTRYVLGPVGLNRSAIAHAGVTEEAGQWLIRLTFTPKGAAQWDTFAARTFHEISAVVINGHVVTAPITQPTQSSFTSFDGQVQIAGGFTEHQAKVIASEL